MVRRALAVLLLAAACSSGPDSGTVTGVITRVSETSVTVRTDGRTESFLNGARDVPVAHLREHATTREPVRVTWERRSRGTREAVRIDDA